MKYYRAILTILLFHIASYKLLAQNAQYYPKGFWDRVIKHDNKATNDYALNRLQKKYGKKRISRFVITLEKVLASDSVNNETNKACLISKGYLFNTDYIGRVYNQSLGDGEALKFDLNWAEHDDYPEFYSFIFKDTALILSCCISYNNDTLTNSLIFSLEFLDKNFSNSISQEAISIIRNSIILDFKYDRKRKFNLK
jgi:hypothetical protein